MSGRAVVDVELASGERGAETDAKIQDVPFASCQWVIPPQPVALGLEMLGT
jgi:hypothetical protein